MLARKITLRASDGEEFEVDEAVAMESQIVKSYFVDNTDDDASGNLITLPAVERKILAMIVEYCTKRVELRADEEAMELRADEEAMEQYVFKFLKEVDNKSMRDLLVSVNYMDIRGLLDVLCQEMADRIKNKSVEFVRDLFGVENDYTPEEEEAKRRENEWAFEGVDQD